MAPSVGDMLSAPQSTLSIQTSKQHGPGIPSALSSWDSSVGQKRAGGRTRTADAAGAWQPGERVLCDCVDIRGGDVSTFPQSKKKDLTERRMVRWFIEDKEASHEALGNFQLHLCLSELDGVPTPLSTRRVSDCGQCDVAVVRV